MSIEFDDQQLKDVLKKIVSLIDDLAHETTASISEISYITHDIDVVQTKCEELQTEIDTL